MGNFNREFCKSITFNLYLTPDLVSQRNEKNKTFPGNIFRTCGIIYVFNLDYMPRIYKKTKEVT